MYVPRRLSTLAAAMSLLVPLCAGAELIVVYDSGRSWPMDRYLKPLLAQPAVPEAVRRGPLVADLGPADLDHLLPIRSPGLTPGPVATRPFDAPVPVAFFMVGADPESLGWLAAHRDYLQRQGAIGLLVNASNEDDVQAVLTAAGDLPIAPASGEQIASALQIKHYPVAITEGRIWQ